MISKVYLRQVLIFSVQVTNDFYELASTTFCVTFLAMIDCVGVVSACTLLILEHVAVSLSSHILPIIEELTIVVNAIVGLQLAQVIRPITNHIRIIQVALL